MQRELVVASAHLVHHVRLACVQDPEGTLSPAQMPGVLLGAALLSPQFMDTQFLQEAEHLLGDEKVMQELPPASVAALMSAFTIVRTYCYMTAVWEKKFPLCRRSSCNVQPYGIFKVVVMMSEVDCYNAEPSYSQPDFFSACFLSVSMTVVAFFIPACS